MKAVDRSIQKLILLIYEVIYFVDENELKLRNLDENELSQQIAMITTQLSDLREKISGVASMRFDYQQNLNIIDANIDVINEDIVSLQEEENIDKKRDMMVDTNNSIKNYLENILTFIEDIKTMRLEQMKRKQMAFRRVTQRDRTSSRPRSRGGKKSRKKTKKSRKKN